jgi:SAM-dependent methyltransferase
VSRELENVPAPTVMPIDREAWAKNLNLSNFINSYYQYRDLSSLTDVQRLLVVGPGQGLDTMIFRWRGYEVTTLDIDDTFSPDVTASVHDMHMFGDRQFDVVIASHVIEHQAEPYLDSSLAEIARVGRYALIYLPVAGRHFHVRFMPGVLSIDKSILFDIFNWFHSPDGVTARYCGKQHFWEIGMRGWKVKDLLRRFESHFDVLSVYRNVDWTPSQNFVLRSKRWTRA